MIMGAAKRNHEDEDLDQDFSELEELELNEIYADELMEWIIESDIREQTKIDLVEWLHGEEKLDDECYEQAIARIDEIERPARRKA